MSDRVYTLYEIDAANRELTSLRALVADLVEQGRDNGYKIIADLRAEVAHLNAAFDALYEQHMGESIADVMKANDIAITEDSGE